MRRDAQGRGVPWRAAIATLAALAAASALRGADRPSVVPATTAARTAPPQRTELGPAPGAPALPVGPDPADTAAEPPAPLGAPAWDGEGDPDRSFVRARLEALVGARRPQLALSSGALESAVDAALALHRANRDIAALGDGADRARADAIRARARRAADDLRAILELDAADVPPLR